MGNKKKTVGEIFDEMLVTHWGLKRFEKSGWKTEVIGLFERRIEKPFGKAKLQSLGPKKLRAWHSSMRAFPTEANRARSVLSKIFEYALGEEYYYGANPVDYVPLFREVKRDRYATEEEIAKILNILERDKEKFPEAVLFIYMALYSGARPQSLIELCLDDFTEIEGGYAVVHFFGKSFANSGDKESLLFPPQVFQMIKDHVAKLDRKIFPNPKIFKQRVPHHYWSKLRKEINAPDLVLRDLRRTFATIGLSQDLTKDVIGGLLNHKSEQTTARYAKLDIRKRLGAAMKIEERINEISKTKSKNSAA